MADQPTPVPRADLHTDFLAEFSDAVRDSTLKRLRRVPEGVHDWRPEPGALSFAEVAAHLVACDAWLFAKWRDPSLPNEPEPAPGSGDSPREDFLVSLAKLERTRSERRALIEATTDSEWQLTLHDARFGEATTRWWLLVRGNLDHEIHHRGQIAAYLRACGSGKRRTP